MKNNSIKIKSNFIPKFIDPELVKRMNEELKHNRNNGQTFEFKFFSYQNRFQPNSNNLLECIQNLNENSNSNNKMSFGLKKLIRIGKSKKIEFNQKKSKGDSTMIKINSSSFDKNTFQKNRNVELFVNHNRLFSYNNFRRNYLNKNPSKVASSISNIPSKRWDEEYLNNLSEKSYPKNLEGYRYERRNILKPDNINSNLSLDEMNNCSFTKERSDFQNWNNNEIIKKMSIKIEENIKSDLPKTMKNYELLNQSENSNIIFVPLKLSNYKLK